MNLNSISKIMASLCNYCKQLNPNILSNTKQNKLYLFFVLFEFSYIVIMI